MCSCVFWCESSIDLVVFLSRCCYCVTHVTPFIRRSKGCTEKNSRRSGPCSLEGGLRPENPSNPIFFSPEAKFYHPYISGNDYSEIFPHMLLEMSIFSRHVQNTFFRQVLDFESGHRALARGQNSLDRTWLNLTEIQFQDFWFVFT